MWDIVELFSAVGEILEMIYSLFKNIGYFFRGWGFLLFPKYRRKLLSMYKEQSALHNFFDILATILISCVEVWLIVWGITVIFFSH